MQSSYFYTLITTHWPKIALGIVIGVAILENLVNADSPGSRLEWYFLAWSSMTGGLWFLFDIAEKSSSRDSREKVTLLIKNVDVGNQLEVIPQKFAATFDLIFGERHFTFLCFRRSVLASIVSAWIVAALVYSIDPSSFGILGDSTGVYAGPNQSLYAIGTIGVAALLVSIFPDYLSLLQTRYFLRLMKNRSQVIYLLVVDAIITGLIFIVITQIGLSLMLTTGMIIGDGMAGFSNPQFWELQAELFMDYFNYLTFQVEGLNTFGILFLTTYFTSIWLWLYVLALLISRFLISINQGVGFVLRVTDVELQPFRSLGFVSVLLVSLLFFLGLPLVYL